MLKHRELVGCLMMSGASVENTIDKYDEAMYAQCPTYFVQISSLFCSKRLGDHHLHLDYCSSTKPFWNLNCESHSNPFPNVQVFAHCVDLNHLACPFWSLVCVRKICCLTNTGQTLQALLRFVTRSCNLCVTCSMHPCLFQNYRIVLCQVLSRTCLPTAW